MSESPEPAVEALKTIPAPPLDFRWVHTGTKQLQLPTIPITVADAIYQPFSNDENKRIEDTWMKKSSEERKAIVEQWGKEDGEWGRKSRAHKKEEKEKVKDKSEKLGRDKRDSLKEIRSPESGSSTPMTSDGEMEEMSSDKMYKSIIERAQSDPTRLDVVDGVPVSQDSLFEVDLETLSLHPVFWPQSGPRIPVLRGSWFMIDETKPCTWDLAREIENAYLEIKPWLPSYKEEFATAMALGPSGEEKLKHPLPQRFGHGLGVIFEGDDRCRIITSGTFDYLSRYVWSSIGSKPGGTHFYRGYAAASSAKEAEKTARKDGVKRKENRRGTPADDTKGKSPTKDSKDKDPATTSKTEVPPPEPSGDSLQDIMGRVKQEFENKKKALEEANAPVIHARNEDQPCTDLILVVHGIGQSLATQYESFNFIYASNQLRQVLRKQSLDPALASVMRDRRCQVLPVQWRANLNLESETHGQDKEYERENVFTIADITIGKSIPYIRELTNSVLLDIPLFMSEHKRLMIEAVCQQANKMYRMWIARNPGFEKNGRVHIIGHSLGSALAAEILSNQPTSVPEISQMPKQVIDEVQDRFIFNTHNLFLAGSPLGVFLQLQQAHVIARTGRTRTMHARPDEALNRAGKFGCMAIDSLYNIFYPTDPVAYAVNPAVDVKVAKTRPPLPISSVTPSKFPSMPSLPPLPSLPAMPTMPAMPDVAKYLPSYFGGTTEKPPKKEEPAPLDSPEMIEMNTDESTLVGSRGERRFAALNPRGSIDYALPSSSVNDYLDMITAHGNYWSDHTFGAFILNETFASASDEARTGCVETVKVGTSTS